VKRLLVFACLLALAAVAALTGTLSSAHGSTAQSHIGGVVPVRGAKVPALGIPLVYHGGPVMVTNKTYAIYWKPAGFSMAPGYDTTINQYFTDVAHDSGLGSNVYASDTQYHGPGTTMITYNSTFGGSVTDTNSYPASGCPLYNGLPVCLTDAQLQTEINNVIASQGWAKNATNMFFVFTAQNVGSCFDSSGSTCAFTAYCAYHGTTNSGAIYANQPYTGSTAGCDEGEYPNGSANQADPTINVTSHEHNEAITDPQLNAWYDNQGAENGDKCAWNFGPVSGAAGGQYNQTINGHHYFLQMEWSNTNPMNTCVQTYAITGGGGNAPSISSFFPYGGRVGTTVILNGKNFTGTTKVTLHNVTATYTVNSSTKITTRVPYGTPKGNGKWQVTTPAGTATSAQNFYVQ
jgi:hypothetical protein